MESNGHLPDVTSGTAGQPGQRPDCALCCFATPTRRDADYQTCNRLCKPHRILVLHTEARHCRYYVNLALLQPAEWTN